MMWKRGWRGIAVVAAFSFLKASYELYENMKFLQASYRSRDDISRGRDGGKKHDNSVEASRTEIDTPSTFTEKGQSKALGSEGASRYQKHANVMDSKTSGTLAQQEKTHNISHGPRIAYITFSHLGPSNRWWDVIVPAAEVIVPSTDSYYVVMTKESQAIYENLTQSDPLFRNASRRIQPIYVDCPEGKFGESPCCKQEKGLVQFHDDFYLDQNKRPNYEWVLFQDDDMNIRSKELQVFVTELPVNEPMILASDSPEGHFLGQEGYMKYRGEYRCSRNDNRYRYPWGQPVVYNQAAFEAVVEHAFRLGGLVRQCLVFGVTHDVGNALIHWMFSFPALWMRVSDITSPSSQLVRDDFLGMHQVGRHGAKSSMYHIHKRYTTDPGLQYSFNSSNPQRMWSNTTGF